MATTDKRASRAVAFGSFCRERVVLDFAKVNYGAGDIVKLFNVYAGDIVEEILVNVDTAEGGTATADIGDYTTGMSAVDADGYHYGVNLNAAALNKSGGAYGGRKCYVADNVIAILINDAVDAGKVTIEAIINRAQR